MKSFTTQRRSVNHLHTLNPGKEELAKLAQNLTNDSTNNPLNQIVISDINNFQ